MEWEVKVQLAKALNTGDNKTACNIILNNEMDLQAWDMFLTGMNLSQSDDYRPIIEKLLNSKKTICDNLGLREIIRMNAFIKNLNVINYEIHN